MDVMFRELDIETCSSCNRFCPTCLRNSSPKADVADRFGKQRLMPAGMFYDIIDQAADMGFTGVVNLSHFNEPLQDERLGAFGAYAKAKGVFSAVMFHTNADLLTERRAEQIDGNFDCATVALYDGLDTTENRARLQALVPNVNLIWTGGEHIVTHFSPRTDELKALIEQARPQPCQLNVQRRMIIDYKGNMLLCCEDIGAFPSFGNVAEKSLRELWFSSKHLRVMETLNEPGGREAYAYCRSCPRLNEEME